VGSKKFSVTMVPANRADGNGWEGGVKCSHHCCFGERHSGREFMHFYIAISFPFPFPL